MRPTTPLRRFAPAFAIAALVFAPSARAADAPPADIGAFLAAGHALREAFAGRHGVTRQDLPGTVEGMDVRPGKDKPIDTTRLRKRLYEDGRAYAAGDSTIVTTIEVSRREITIVLGHGGYDPAHLDGDSPADASWRRRYIEWELSYSSLGTPSPLQGWAQSGPSGTWQGAQLTPEGAADRKRDLEEQSREAIKAQDDAAQNERQMRRHRIAAVAGSRIHLRFDHDIPLADLDAAKVGKLLAPYLSLAE